jgi:hypothetical protein
MLQLFAFMQLTVSVSAWHEPNPPQDSVQSAAASQLTVTPVP